MGTTLIAPDKYRAMYQRILNRTRSKQIPDDKVQWSYLRVHVLADATKNIYDVIIKKDVGTSAIHERKLDPNDAFCMVQLGHFLMAEDPTKSGTGVLQTYPNNTVFPAEAGNVTPAHLQIFWNAYYRIKVGDRVYAEAIQTKNNYHARTTQQASASTFSENWPEDGFQDLSPDITFDGANKNEIQLVTPSFAGIQIQYITAAPRNSFVFLARGWQIIGGSKLGLSDF